MRTRKDELGEPERTPAFEPQRSSPAVARVLALQRTAGNAAVGRWLAREATESEALDQNLAPAFAQAGVRVPNARQEAIRLAAGAQTAAATVVTVAQEALQEIDAWRSSVDQRALRRLDTDAAAEAGWATGAFAWDVAGLAAELHPITRAIYTVIDLAVAAGSIAVAADTADANAGLVQASDAAGTLSVAAQDEILQAILTSQTSAVSLFNRVYGQLLATTDPSGAGAYGLAMRQAGREHGQLQAAPGPVEAGTVEDAEAAGLGLLDVADRADALLAGLRQAHGVLTQAPERIRRGAVQRLLEAQTQFAGSSGHVRLRGQLVRHGPQARALRVSPAIGAGQLHTELSEQSTWRDFAELGTAVDLTLQLQAPFLEPQIAAAPEWQQLSTGLEATVHLGYDGNVRWGGSADAGTIGMLMLGDLGPSGVGGELRPAYGRAGTPPVASEADRAAGRALQAQVVEVLFAAPLGSVRDAPL